MQEDDSTIITSVGLNLTVTLEDSIMGNARVSMSAVLELSLNETNNRPYCQECLSCPYVWDTAHGPSWTAQHPCCPFTTKERPCSDRVSLSSGAPLNFTVGRFIYSLQVLGFSSSCEMTNEGRPPYLSDFISEEASTTSMYLVGILTLACSSNRNCFTPPDQAPCSARLCDTSTGRCYLQPFNQSCNLANPCTLDGRCVTDPGIS